jgi:stage III sporulation protein AH
MNGGIFVRKNWKKNVLATAVLVTVCGGIYLNWRFTSNQNTKDLVNTFDAQKVMSDDLLVMSDTTDLLTETGTTTSDDYFAAVRLSRQQARDSAVSVLQEAMSYGEETEASTTSGQLDDIVQTALCEAQIESLVIAKGYTDCVAYISDEGVSVAVASPEGGLEQSDVAVIADIVITQSEYTMDQIRVVEVQ